jgi:phosphatidate phosphatase LPIN
MTGYKTDSCSDSSDDDDDLPRGILSDSERHHGRLRKKFGRKGSRLSKEQREQLLEDIKQGAFLKPEEQPTGVPVERRGKFVVWVQGILTRMSRISIVNHQDVV